MDGCAGFFTPTSPPDLQSDHRSDIRSSSFSSHLQSPSSWPKPLTYTPLTLLRQPRINYSWYAKPSPALLMHSSVPSSLLNPAHRSGSPAVKVRASAFWPRGKSYFSLTCLPYSWNTNGLYPCTEFAKVP